MRSKKRHRLVRLLACGALGWALAAAAPANADPASVVNALRTGGCGKEAAVGTRLRPNASLDVVARELSRNRSLEKAFEGSDYPVMSSTSFHVRGSSEDAEVGRILAQRYCASIADERYTDLGVFQRGNETWIVLAVRQAAAPVLDPAAAAERVLELVNAARAEARRCGRDHYAAVPPLTLSAALTQAAVAHAHDMALRGELTHEGSDGSISGDRITRAGYAWRAAGENVAAGQQTPDAAVAGWLKSPGHCATLMGPQYTQMGVAFALAPGKNPGIYWAQVFAAPR